jgi:hypothetical protein
MARSRPLLGGDGILCLVEFLDMEAATISRITVEPGKRGGEPNIRALRIWRRLIFRTSIASPPTPVAVPISR